MLQLPESKFIIEKLTADLAPNLYYHSIDHTLDVYRMSEYFAKCENVAESDLKLLLIAALYHDSGYLYQRKDHENRSCEIVKDVLPKFGYSENEMVTICRMIMATKLPQTAESLVEKIICDADLDYLGRDDFFETGERLYREMVAAGMLSNPEEWNELQVNFLQNHHYFTPTAQRLRNQKKEDNLRIVLSKI